MPGAPIHTWRDLLLPNEQDTHRVILYQVTEEQRTAVTSSFSLLAWDPEKLPSAAHLFEDLPSRMHEHLRVIIDQHFSDQAARTSFKNREGRSVTPVHVIERLRDNCADYTLYLSYETGTRTIAECLSCSVKVVYAALTGNFLDVQGQEPSSNGAVITSRVFQFDDGIKILWAEKSSRAFDRFIGELMEQMRDRSTVELCIEPVATTYRGYKAILGKVRVFVPVRHHLSVSCLSPAWVPCERDSAPGPLGNRIQRSPLYDHLHPTHTRKTSNVLLAGDAVLSSARR